MDGLGFSNEPSCGTYKRTGTEATWSPGCWQGNTGCLMYNTPPHTATRKAYSTGYPGLCLCTHDIVLQDTNTSTTGSSLKWIRMNTRLLESSTGQVVTATKDHLLSNKQTNNETEQSEWRQTWTVSFIASDYEGPPLQERVEHTTPSITQCYKPSPAFSASFDDFSKVLIIDDAGDEEQCGKVREGLGFDKDHPFDTEVRDSFHQQLCDPFHTGIDDKLEALSAPPKFEMVDYTPVEYEAVEYTEDEYATIDYEEFTQGDDLGDLTESVWPDLYESTGGLSDLTGIFSDDGKAEDQTPVDNVASNLVAFRKSLSEAELIFQFVVTKTKALCDVLPENPCVGASFAIVCLPNPAYYVCRVATILTDVIASSVLEGVNLAFSVLESTVEAGTLDASQAFYGYYYSRAAYLNEIGHSEWTQKALDAIRVNMKDQHMQMKAQMQERHKDIANHVGQDIADAQNALGQAIVDARNDIGQGNVDTQNALGQQLVDAQNALGQGIVESQNYITSQHNDLGEWLHTNLCLIYATSGGNCDPEIGPLQEDQAFIPMILHWPDDKPNLIERLEQFQDALSLSVLDDFTQGDGEIADASNTARALEHTQDLEVIKGKVDALSNSVQGKVDDVEGKVDAMQGKVDNVEGKVDAMQGKLDNVEGKVDGVQDELKEVKVMLSKLMDILAKD